MPKAPRLTPEIQEVTARMEAFEATEGVANTGTGARREGGDFEVLTGTLWHAFSALCTANGATSTRVPGTRCQINLVWYRRYYHKLELEGRTLYIPIDNVRESIAQPQAADAPRWLEAEYRVDQLVQSFPGEAEAVRRYAPHAGAFSGNNYPKMYTGLSTGFDGTIVLVQDGILFEKILLEYKTAKSSRQRQIDGNAHERLSFQIMQYLEVATRYTKCSFVVLANGAFVRYRNKYHVNFHVQADRLRNFAWFSMEHACTSQQHSRFLTGLLTWLFEGTKRPTGDAQ